MAQTSRYSSSYRYATSGNTALQRSAAPQSVPRPGVRVLPGRRGQQQSERTLSVAALFGFRAIIAIVAVMAIALGIRVWLSVATVQSMQSIESLQQDVTMAQAQGSDLEIQHSVLASPQRIEKQATELGMSEPDSVTRLTVSLPAHAVCNEDGSLSFSRTLKTVENAAASTL